MDVQSFLESGLLEAYVLGQCSAEERLQVERMLEAHPEVRAELEAIERALEQLAAAHAVSPPAGLRERIEQEIRREAGAREPSAHRRPSLLKKGFSLLPWAAALLLGIALIWSVRHQRHAEEEVQQLQQQLTDCHTRVRQQERHQEIIALLRDPNTRTILLGDVTPEQKIGVSVTVWHNANRAQTVLDRATLPLPPAGKYFQFWAIVQGKPLSMGMIAVQGEEPFLYLPFVPEAQAFAISAEDKPEGNPTPTEVVLVGKI